MSWARVIWFWLRSRTARQALDQLRTVRRLIRLQRDRLAPEALVELHQARLELIACWLAAADLEELRRQMSNLRATAGRYLVNPSERRSYEVFDILLVAFVVVMAIRTFLGQPMTIPSGSMQPTLHGITTENLLRQPGATIPGPFRRLVDRWIFGRTYYHVVAKAEGRVTRIEPPEPIISWPPFLRHWQKQRFQIGNTWHTIWLPPRELQNPYGLNPARLLFVLAGVDRARVYRPGEDVIKLAVIAGDHILVDRLTYNFRHPKRGEMVVFNTHGISGIHEATFYIKRLVALPGERVRIGDDRHLIINGRRLDANTPHFENVYGFDGPPRENSYSGHVNDLVAQLHFIRRGTLAPLFPTGNAEYQVRPGHYMVMGDNTMESFDSRRWGDFDESLIIGRYWAIYWPISDRIGWTVD